jgi:hypothetical protein
MEGGSRKTKGRMVVGGQLNEYYSQTPMKRYNVNNPV